MRTDTAEELCWRIVTAVARERGIKPCDVSERLHDVIDIESLARLTDQAWNSDAIDLSVSFRIADCFVTVTGDETVRATVPE